MARDPYDNSYIPAAVERFEAFEKRYGPMLEDLMESYEQHKAKQAEREAVDQNAPAPAGEPVAHADPEPLTPPSIDGAHVSDPVPGEPQTPAEPPADEHADKAPDQSDGAGQG